MNNGTLGIDFIIKYNKGTDASPDYVVLGGQRGASLSQSVETHEITVKGGDGWRDYIAGTREWSIDCDGIYFVDNESFELFNEAYLKRKKLQINVNIPNTAKQYEGKVLIENLDLDMNYDDLVTYSTTLLGSGALTIVVNEEIVEALGFINQGMASLVDFEAIGVEGVTSNNISAVNTAITSAKTAKGSDLTIVEIIEVVNSL